MILNKDNEKFSKFFFKLSPWLMLAVCLGANFFSGISNGLKERPSGWHVDAVPVVLSEKYYHHPADYTMLMQVKEIFHANTGSRDASSVNGAIQVAQKIPPDQLNRKEKTVLSNDDKGIVDYVKLSFLFFGEKTESFFYLYIFLLTISCLIFVIRFLKKSQVLGILFCLLTAHAAVIPLAAINPQIQNIYSPRFISVLGLFPVLYLLCLIIDSPKSSKWSLGLDGIQCLLLLFIAHIRLTVLSQIVAVAVCMIGISIFLMILKKRKWNECFFALRQKGGIFLLIFFLIVGVFVDGIFLNSRISNMYRQKPHIVRRVMWHNFLSGLAFHPQLKSHYRLKVDDVSVIASVGRWLIEEDREQEWISMGGISEGFSDIAWTPYDSACREMFWNVLQEHPWKFFSSIVFYKPIAFLKEFFWHMGLIKSYPHMGLLHPSHASQMIQMQNAVEDKPLKFWNILALVVVIYMVLSTVFSANGNIAKYIITSVVFFLISTIPILVGYPLSQSLGETLLGWITLIYSSIAFLLIRVLFEVRKKFQITA